MDRCPRPFHSIRACTGDHIGLRIETATLAYFTVTETNLIAFNTPEQERAYALYGLLFSLFADIKAKSTAVTGWRKAPPEVKASFRALMPNLADYNDVVVMAKRRRGLQEQLRQFRNRAAHGLKTIDNDGTLNIFDAAPLEKSPTETEAQHKSRIFKEQVAYSYILDDLEIMASSLLEVVNDPAEDEALAQDMGINVDQLVRTRMRPKPTREVQREVQSSS